MNYYQILGLEYDMNCRPSYYEVRTAWRNALIAEHPDNNPQNERAKREALVAEIMSAWHVLSNESRAADYHTLLGTNGHEHARAVCKPAENEVIVDDWLCMILDATVVDAACERADGEDMFQGRAVAAVRDLPAFITGDRVKSIPGLDVSEIVQILCLEMESMGDIARLLRDNINAISIMWRSTARKSRGKIVAGEVRKLREQDRARLPGPDAAKPLIEIELALDVWLVASPKERAFIVHHELCHVAVDFGDDEGPPKISMKGHDAELHLADFEHFGALLPGMAQAVVAAMQHPEIVKHVAASGLITGEQLSLFTNFVNAAFQHGRDGDAHMRQGINKHLDLMGVDEAQQLAEELHRACGASCLPDDARDEWRGALEEMLHELGSMPSEQDAPHTITARLRAIERNLDRWDAHASDMVS